MAILYDTEETLRERVSNCLDDQFKHDAIRAAQEAFYVKRGQLVEEMEGWQDLRVTWPRISFARDSIVLMRSL